MQRAFKLALEMGTARIARELRAMGVTQAERDEPITKGGLDAILRSMTVLGWRQNTSNNKSVGEPDKGVYPAIITTKEFETFRSRCGRGTRRTPPMAGIATTCLRSGLIALAADHSLVFAMPAMVMRSHAAGRRRMGATCQTSATTKTSCWV